MFMRLSFAALAARFGVLVLAAALPATSFAIQTQVVIKTDSTWKLIGNTNVAAPPPPAGWNSSASFDDTGWPAATVVGPEQPGNIPLTPFVWDSTGSTGATQIVWTRKVFPVNGQILSAVLDEGCDDDAQVWINGARVVNDTNGSATAILGTNIAPFLVQGNNVIAAQCTNVQPPFHAFGAIVTVQVDVPQVVLAVPTMPQGALVLAVLALAATGALALGCRR